MSSIYREAARQLRLGLKGKRTTQSADRRSIAGRGRLEGKHTKPIVMGQLRPGKAHPWPLVGAPQPSLPVQKAGSLLP
jgi:hypothetical protein